MSTYEMLATDQEKQAKSIILLSLALLSNQCCFTVDCLPPQYQLYISIQSTLANVSCYIYYQPLTKTRNHFLHHSVLHFHATGLLDPSHNSPRVCHSKIVLFLLRTRAKQIMTNFDENNWSMCTDVIGSRRSLLIFTR